MEKKERDINYCELFDIKNIEFKESGNFVAVDSDEKIEILLLESNIISAKFFAGEKTCNYTGKYLTKIIYCDEQGRISATNLENDFSYDIKNSNISADSNIFPVNCFVQTQYSINNNNINFVITQFLDMEVQNKCLISQKESVENIVCKYDNIEYLESVEVVDGRFACEYEMIFKEDIVKILHNDIKFVPISYTALSGSVKIMGNLTVSIIAQVEKDGNVFTINKTESSQIKGEILANVVPENVLMLDSKIKLDEINIISEKMEQETNLNVEMVIVVNGECFKSSKCEMISDAYSTNFEIEKETRNLVLQNIFQLQNHKLEANQEISVDADIDDIIGVVSVNTNILEKIKTENEFLINGIVESLIIYIDENGIYKSIKSETKFSHNIVTEADDIFVKCLVDSSKAKIKRGNIFIEYNIDCNIFGKKYKSIQYIETIKDVSPIEYDASYQIYQFQKGESTWQLCKRLHMTEEMLKKCNPDLNFVEGERFFIKR